MLDMALVQVAQENHLNMMKTKMEYERLKREQEIAEQGIRAAITYERGLEKRREIGRNIITVILGLVDIAVFVGLLLDAFFI